MYAHRKRKSFSFSRLVSIAMPFASDGPGFVEVTLQRKDMLYSHQMVLKHPEALDEKAFYVAGVCDRERQSGRILDELLKNGVIDSETGAIHTAKIGPRFLHQLSFLEYRSQKNLVNVLFFWEEEVHRLKKLNAEDEELTTLITEAERVDEGMYAEKETLDKLKFTRERVRMKKRQKPSQRHPDIEADTDATVSDAFLAKGGTLQTPDGVPPSYAGHAQSLSRHQSVA